MTRLGAILSNLRASTIVETDPVGVPDEQPPYLNAVVVGETSLEPRALLGAILDIERARGRRRTAWRAARTLDLDLILYGDLQCDLPGLTVPHPRFRDRDFVLRPLAEIAPEWIDPATHRSIGELARSLNEPMPPGE